MFLVLEMEQFSGKLYAFEDENYVANQAPPLGMFFPIWPRENTVKKMGPEFSSFKKLSLFAAIISSKEK